MHPARGGAHRQGRAAAPVWQPVAQAHQYAHPAPVALAPAPARCRAPEADPQGGGYKRYHTEYEFLQIIGTGSYGKALLSRRKSDGLEVVVKVLKARGERHNERARQEMEILSNLEHPYIVKYFGSWAEGERRFMVMEYAEGGDLARKIREQRTMVKAKFSESQILVWFTQVAVALFHLHQHHILHRDLKSSNVFLCHNQQMVKLGDFGVSKQLGGSGEFARTIIGTPFYLSPEMVNRQSYNAKTDVWALGVLLFELMHLELPFRGHTQAELHDNIRYNRRRRLSTAFSKDLRDLCDRMLDPDRTQRPSAAAVLRTHLVSDFVERRQMDCLLGNPPPRATREPSGEVRRRLSYDAPSASGGHGGQQRARQQDRAPLEGVRPRPACPLGQPQPSAPAELPARTVAADRRHQRHRAAPASGAPRGDAQGAARAERHADPNQHHQHAQHSRHADPRRHPDGADLRRHPDGADLHRHPDGAWAGPQAPPPYHAGLYAPAPERQAPPADVAAALSGVFATAERFRAAPAGDPAAARAAQQERRPPLPQQPPAGTARCVMCEMHVPLTDMEHHLALCLEPTTAVRDMRRVEASIRLRVQELDAHPLPLQEQRHADPAAAGYPERRITEAQSTHRRQQLNLTLHSSEEREKPPPRLCGAAASRALQTPAVAEPPLRSAPCLPYGTESSSPRVPVPELAAAVQRPPAGHGHGLPCGTVVSAHSPPGSSPPRTARQAPDPERSPSSRAPPATEPARELDGRGPAAPGGGLPASAEAAPGTPGHRGSAAAGTRPPRISTGQERQVRPVRPAGPQPAAAGPQPVVRGPDPRPAPATSAGAGSSRPPRAATPAPAASAGTSRSGAAASRSMAGSGEDAHAQPKMVGKSRQRRGGGGGGGAVSAAKQGERRAAARKGLGDLWRSGERAAVARELADIKDRVAKASGRLQQQAQHPPVRLRPASPPHRGPQGAAGPAPQPEPTWERRAEALERPSGSRSPLDIEHDLSLDDLSVHQTRASPPSPAREPCSASPQVPPLRHSLHSVYSPVSAVHPPAALRPAAASRRAGRARSGAAQQLFLDPTPAVAAAAAAAALLVSATASVHCEMQSTEALPPSPRHSAELQALMQTLTESIHEAAEASDDDCDWEDTRPWLLEQLARCAKDAPAAAPKFSPFKTMGGEHELIGQDFQTQLRSQGVSAADRMTVQAEALGKLLDEELGSDCFVRVWRVLRDTSDRQALRQARSLLGRRRVRYLHIFLQLAFYARSLNEVQVPMP